MTIDEAIKILDDIYLRGYKLTTKEHYAALKLLIEAGKLIKFWRQDNVYPDYTLLPGETEE
jgi:hypothetical protein